MKKSYITPTVQVVPLKMRSHVLIESVTSNVGISGRGDVSYAIEEDDIR
jgi:hypothetical protein